MTKVAELELERGVAAGEDKPAREKSDPEHLQI